MTLIFGARPHLNHIKNAVRRGNIHIIELLRGYMLPLSAEQVKICFIIAVSYNQKRMATYWLPEVKYDLIDWEKLYRNCYNLEMREFLENIIIEND